MFGNCAACFVLPEEMSCASAVFMEGAVDVSHQPSQVHTGQRELLDEET